MATKSRRKGGAFLPAGGLVSGNTNVFQYAVGFLQSNWFTGTAPGSWSIQFWAGWGGAYPVMVAKRAAGTSGGFDNLVAVPAGQTITCFYRIVDATGELVLQGPTTTVLS